MCGKNNVYAILTEEVCIVDYLKLWLSVLFDVIETVNTLKVTLNWSKSVDGTDRGDYG